MNVAILDLGTNTFHLIIAEFEERGKFRILHKNKLSVKLLEGTAGTSLIQPVPFARGLKVMKEFASAIREFKVEQVHAVATSAVRSAVNGNLFAHEILKQTGIDVRVISGDEEAQLIYEGVKQTIGIGNDPVLILDIGGGSNEFIICNDEKIMWKKSYNLGAARLLSEFNPSDPIAEQDIQSLINHFRIQLSDLQEQVKKFKAHTLIGSSGSFDTFAEMIAFRNSKKPFVKGQSSYAFDMEEFNALHRLLLSSDEKARNQMPGLIKMRVDMIVIASLFTDFVIQFCGIKNMKLAKGSLKDGLLAKVSQA